MFVAVSGKSILFVLMLVESNESLKNVGVETTFTSINFYLHSSDPVITNKEINKSYFSSQFDPVIVFLNAYLNAKAQLFQKDSDKGT